jgi:hypothetical protein
MIKHRCEDCPFRKKYDENPSSLIGRLWRWHITVCPGWKRFYNTLDEAKRSELKERYRLAR